MALPLGQYQSGQKQTVAHTPVVTANTTVRTSIFTAPYDILVTNVDLLVETEGSDADGVITWNLEYVAEGTAYGSGTDIIAAARDLEADVGTPPQTVALTLDDTDGVYVPAGSVIYGEAINDSVAIDTAFVGKVFITYEELLTA